MRKPFALSAILVAALCLAPFHHAIAATFTLSTPDPGVSSITIAANNFSDLVKKGTNGEIVIEVKPNGVLFGGDPPRAIAMAGDGSLDMLLLSASLYANLKPRFIAVSIPYLFDDMKQFQDYLAGDAAETLKEDVASLGIHPVGFWPRPFRVITNSKRPVRTPADLAGVKIRVPNNPLWVEFFASMGAEPTPMRFGEVFAALKSGAVDGQENPVSIAMDAKFYEVQKYLTFTNHIADAWVLGVNQRKWDALPDDAKRAIEDAAVRAQADKVRFDADGAGKTEAFLKAKKMQTYHLTPDEQRQFVEVAKKLYPRFGQLVKDDVFLRKTLEFVGKN